MTTAGQGRMAAILFTDVATALHAAKDDAEERRILGVCDELVRAGAAR